MKDKIAIVTGGAKGLGAAIVRLFVEKGARVVIADVDAACGEALAEQLAGRAVFKQLDVTSEDNWERVMEETLDEFGRLDCLVNNAGIVEIGDIECQTTEEWHRVNAIVSDGTYFGCRYAVRAMKVAGGTIVNVASVSSLQGESYAVAYTASKGAVESLTRAVAVHCAQQKYPIRCNSIHPGGIATPLVDVMRPKIEKAVKAGMKMPAFLSYAGGYTAEPEDIAQSVLFLASDQSKWVNGTRLVVDNTTTVTRGGVPA